MSTMTGHVYTEKLFSVYAVVIFGRNLIMATIATVCLLYSMYLLVHQDFPDVIEKPHIPIPPVTMKIPEYIAVRLPEPPVRPVEIVAPKSVDVFEPITTEPNGGGISIDPIVIAKPPVTGEFIMEGQMLPFVKVAPAYPSNAAMKGIEGYVDVLFDVTEIGTTTNIRVVGFSPSTIFNKSVIKSIKGWKYKPNVVDGIAVKTFDIKERIRFNLDK